jgi:cell division septation protein DedD
MRDGSRRVRDKFDISLEPRQVALLFVLCLVILILVFALGIIVGRGLKNPTGVPATAQVVSEAEQPPVDAAIDDSEAPAAVPTEDEAPKLKFFAEGQQTPQREVSAVPPAPVIPPVEEEATEPAPSAAPVAAAKVEAPPAAAPKPEPKKAPAKAEKKEEPKKVAKKEPAKSASAGKFTVQVSAFQNRAQADHLVSNLKNKGYDAYIAQATIPGKGVWYRVRIGKYPNRDAAQSTANTLKRKEGISTYVTLAQ